MNAKDMLKNGQSFFRGFLPKQKHTKQSKKKYLQLFSLVPAAAALRQRPNSFAGHRAGPNCQY